MAATSPRRDCLIVDRCVSCNRQVGVRVASDDYERWQRGAYAQDAFPYLPPGEREFLISRVCEPCFDRAFAEPDLSDLADTCGRCGGCGKPVDPEDDGGLCLKCEAYEEARAAGPKPTPRDARLDACLALAGGETVYACDECADRGFVPDAEGGIVDCPPCAVGGPRCVRCDRVAYLDGVGLCDACATCPCGRRMEDYRYGQCARCCWVEEGCNGTPDCRCVDCMPAWHGRPDVAAAALRAMQEGLSCTRCGRWSDGGLCDACVLADELGGPPPEPWRCACGRRGVGRCPACN